MATPVNNNGISAKVDVGGAVKVDLKAGGTARVSENQGQGIFQNVNENYTKNPNHSRTDGHAQDRVQQPQTNAQDNGAPPPKSRETAGERRPSLVHKQDPNNLEIGEDAAVVNAPNRGANGRGPHKVGQQGQMQGQTPTKQGPPILQLPNNLPQTDLPPTNPPIIYVPHDNGRHNGHWKNVPVMTNPNLPGNQPTFLPTLGVNYSVNQNLSAHNNQPYGVIRQVVNQVLRQNNIYLSNQTINRLIGNQSFQNSTRSFTPSQPNLPQNVNNLIQTIGRQVLTLLDSSHQNHKLIHQISKEIAHQLRENVQTIRHDILKNKDLGALDFKHLNIKEKMHAAVELLPQHLPAKALEHLQNHRPPEVVNGLLLARGLIVPQDQAANLRNLVASKTSVLPSEISMTALRDFGQLVKTLIADTTAAKTTVNLDLAVQKFVKILLANNELGVLLATVNLANQAPGQAGLISRSLALAQIYELINRLIQAGEKALRDAAPEKNALQNERNIFQTAGQASVEELDETKIQLNKLQSHEAAGALRQFLEFNPAFVHDHSASVFNNPDDARQAQKDFIDFYHQDIVQWLESGKHRFVKDFDFDKPLGVVVERGSEQTFTASTARFVLVRDGSVQGWHFLKSFLVR